jgi:putative thiamine transport system permease protein
VLTRIGPPLAILLLAGPILFGFLGTVLPAFGYLPALGGTQGTLRHFAELFAQPGIWRSATISLCAGIAAAAVALAVVFLFVASWSGTRTFGRILHFVSPLLSVPHAAAAFGFAFLVAPSGLISRTASPWLTGWQQPPDILVVNDRFGLAMMAGLVVKEIPFLLLVTLAAMPQVPLAANRDLARSYGYGRIASFMFTSAPPLYRQIRLAVFAVIAFSSSVVDVAAILGPTTPAPLAVRLVGWMGDPDLSMRLLASAGAVLQLGVTVTAILIWLVLERLVHAAVVFLCERGVRYRRETIARYAAMAAIIISAFTVLGGLAILGLWSIAGLWQFPDALPHSLTFDTWMNVAPRVAGPLMTTLAVAAMSSLAATVIAILSLMREDETGRIRRATVARALIYLPLIVPQAAFLFGLQLFILASGATPTLPLLVAAHVVFVLPYVFLSLSDPWHAFDRRYEAIAAGFGKKRWTAVLAIRLPMLTRAILTAAAVGFAVSVGLYLPTLLIGAGRLPTITTEAVALASGGNRRVIGVYAFLQMLLPAAGFAIATLVPALLFRNRRAMRV